MDEATRTELSERLRRSAYRWRRTSIHGALLSICEAAENKTSPAESSLWEIGAAIKTVATNPNECWAALRELISILRFVEKHRSDI